MTRIDELNRRLFSFPPARWIGRHIYNRQRSRQHRAQSTTTKFFRNLQQLVALDGPLSHLADAGRLSALVAGCSYGCEAFSLAGFLALRFPGVDWRVVGVDISKDALQVAEAGRYTGAYGLGSSTDALAQKLTARLFDRSGDAWAVVVDIRDRVSFIHGDVLSEDFRSFKDYDLVLGQNFMIHMSEEDAATALAALVNASRSGGALFLNGMDLETKTKLLTPHKLIPLEWNIARIHEDDMRRPTWPWNYWSLEPINSNADNYLMRYSTIFLKP